jgi:hypothetical protein
VGEVYEKPFNTLPSLATFHGCTGLSLPRTRDFSGGSFQYFATSATRRLNGARFIGAARHEDTVFAVPFPVEPEACVRHRIRRRSKLGIVPVLPAIGGDLDFANRPRAGPREAADFVESGAGQPLSARREGDHRFRSNLEGQ